MFIFSELVDDGESVFLIFEGNGKKIEVWDMPEEIWYKYDWNPMLGDSKYLGRKFDISIDLEQHYMSKCKLVN